MRLTVERLIALCYLVSGLGWLATKLIDYLDRRHSAWRT